MVPFFGHRVFSVLAVPVLLGSLLLSAAIRPAKAQEWVKIGGSKSNLSGMALFEQSGTRTTFIVVHDNKTAEEPHAALLTLEPEKPPVLTPLAWPSDKAPVDLEAVSAVPGLPGFFAALTSSGTVYGFRVDTAMKTVEILRVVELPKGPEGSNYEGFALAKIGEETMMLWGHRGKTGEPAILYWSRFNLAAETIDEVQSARLTVPFPTTDIRHLSEIKVDDAGIVYISATSDPGDDGPFSSALYVVGTLIKTEFRAVSALTPLRRFKNRKVEAFELIPGKDGGFVFGTDDENLGTWLYRDN